LPRAGQYDGYVRYVSQTYDLRGKLRTSSNTMGMQESMAFDYTPLGALRSSQYASRYFDYASGQTSSAFLTMTETIRPDALGTTTWRQTATQNYNFSASFYSDGRYNASGPSIPEYTPGTGRLARSTTPYAKDTLWYDASGNTIVQQHIDLQSQGSGGATQLEATERVMYYNAADQLVAVDARIGSAPGWTNYLHFLLTFDEYRYDALGRRVFTRSQRRCPSYNLGVYQAASFFVECQLGYVQRTVWDGSKELYEIRMPDLAQHHEKDGLVVGDTLGLVFNSATSKIVDRDAYFGRVGYIYGGAIDKPVVVLRQDYGDRRVTEFWPQQPYRRFQPFALYPQWDLRGEPALGTAADGGKSYCEMAGSVKRCTYALAWTQVYAPTGKRIDGLMKGWTGSLLQDKREPNGLLYRRNRYLDPASGRFTQPDPIGLAGGLNTYGYTAGDPVNFGDPFGLCGVAADSIRVSVQCPNGTIDTTQYAIVRPATAAESGAASSVIAGMSYQGREQNVGNSAIAALPGGLPPWIFAAQSTQGFPVVTAAAWESTGGFLLLREDVAALLMSAGPNSRVPVPVGRSSMRICTAIGHEGLHAVGVGHGARMDRLQGGFRC
jgi:RHS repeat-associated protein